MKMTRTPVFIYILVVTFVTTMTMGLLACRPQPAPTPLPPVLRSLVLTPVSPDELKPGYTLQFTAIGTYSDGAIVDVTSLASWTSSNTNVATISLGLVTAVAEGTARITATKAWLPSQAITLSVIAPEVTLSAIEVTPTLPVELAIGETLQFAASGKYSDGTSADITLQVTWESSNTGAATVSEAGLATGIAAGTTEVTASASGVTSPAVILEITPN